MRRQLVAERDLDADAVERLVGERAGRLVRLLVRRRRTDQYVPLRGGAAAGDELVIYNLDPTRDDELAAANDLFTSVHYINHPDGVWPDERALIEAELPARDADVLEICCGAGRVTAALVREGNRVTGLDANRDCIDYAAAIDRAGVRYQTGDARALPFDDRAFDVGCCFENSLGVFFSSKARALDELLRVSRRRVLCGFRELPDSDGELQVYASREGYIEVAQTFTPATVERLVDGLSQRRHILRRELRAGAPRPWGGAEFFLVLELG